MSSLSLELEERLENFSSSYCFICRSKELFFEPELCRDIRDVCELVSFDDFCNISGVTERLSTVSGRCFFAFDLPTDKNSYSSMFVSGVTDRAFLNLYGCWFSNVFVMF